MFKCELYLRSYDDSDHCPMLFSCGHMMCETDRAKLKNSKECPICHEEGFAVKNLVILEAMQKLKEKSKDGLSTEGTDSKEKTCHRCEEKEGSLYCISCSVDLCENCDKDHHKMGVFKSHQRVSVKDKSQFSAQYCAQHPNQLITHYCKQENKAICSSCKDAQKFCANHNPVSVIDIRAELIEKANQKITELEEKIEGHMNHVLFKEFATKALQEQISSFYKLLEQLQSAGMREIDQQNQLLSPVLNNYSADVSETYSYMMEAALKIKQLKNSSGPFISDSSAVVGAQQALQLLQKAEEWESKELSNGNQKYLEIQVNFPIIESICNSLRQISNWSQSWNPLFDLRFDKRFAGAGLTISEDGRNVSFTSGGGWNTARSSTPLTKGKISWKTTIIQNSSLYVFVGVVTKAMNTNFYIGEDGNGIGYSTGHHTGTVYSLGNARSYGHAGSEKSGIITLLDMDKHEISFKVDGKEFGIASSEVPNEVFVAISLKSIGDCVKISDIKRW